MPKRIGDFIRERRQDLGLTQEELSDRIGEGVRQAEVSRLENNRIVLPRRARMDAIAAALEVSLGDLLVESGWMDEGNLPPFAEESPDPGNEPFITSGTAFTMEEQLASVARQLAGLRTLANDSAVLLDATERAVMTMQRAIANPISPGRHGQERACER
jgi:transcriptional regulator with XRE-family HTH domain